MSTKNDGGTAFPSGSLDRSPVHCHDTRTPGMSLRDWFAGMAIRSAWLQKNTIKQAAEAAYQMADAMLAERSK